MSQLPMQALDVTLETEQTSRLARGSGQLVVRVARGEPRLSASIGSAKPAQTTPLLEAAASLRRRRLAVEVGWSAPVASESCLPELSLNAKARVWLVGTSVDRDRRCFCCTG